MDQRFSKLMRALHVQRSALFFTILLVAPVLLSSEGAASVEIEKGLDRIFASLLEKSPDIQLSVLDYKIARQEVVAGQVDFDPTFTFRPQYKSDAQLSNSTLESAAYRDTTGALSFGLKKKFTYGTVAEIVLQEMWLTSDSIQTTFHHRDQAALQLKVTQPLLLGRGRAANTTTLRKAEAKLMRYEHELAKGVQDVFLRVGGLWVDHLSARLEVDTKIENLQFYKLKLAEATRRKELGQLANLDYLEIESQYFLAEAELQLGRSKLADLEEKIQKELGADQNPLANAIEPLDLLKSLGEDFRPEVRPIDAQGAAMKYSSSTRILEAKLEESLVDLKKAKNGLLPQLDLILQYSRVGVGTNHRDSMNGLIHGNTPSWQVVLNFSWALGGDLAEGERDRVSAEATLRQRSLQLDHQGVILQKKKNGGELQESAEHLANAEASLKNSEFIFLGKSNLFTYGRVSASDLIEARKKLNQARHAWFRGINKFYKTKLALMAVEDGFLEKEYVKAWLASVKL